MCNRRMVAAIAALCFGIGLVLGVLMQSTWLTVFLGLVSLIFGVCLMKES